MSNSPLVSYTKMSPNHSGKRTHAIDRISPHCIVGQHSVEALGNVFAAKSRKASSNYGIGADGRVGMYVDEGNRSWCTSSNANDQRAVTIECASDTTHPYAFKTVVYQKLIDLCEDICRRNGKTVLLWFNDKNKSLNYNPKPNEMVITVHRWFAAKACPGDWLYQRLGEVARIVTERLNSNSNTIKEEDEDMTQETFNKLMNNYISSLAKQPATFEESAMKWAQDNGLITGDENGLMPKKFLTRGEFALVLQRFMDKLK